MSLKYLYDFGEAESGKAYSRLLDAKGRCPPEDVGGPWGYQEYLEAIADPSHERHAEMIEWRGSGFDPKTVEVVEIERELAKLARKLTRKPSKPPRKPAAP